MDTRCKATGWTTEPVHGSVQRLRTTIFLAIVSWSFLLGTGAEDIHATEP